MDGRCSTVLQAARPNNDHQQNQSCLLEPSDAIMKSYLMCLCFLLTTICYFGTASSADNNIKGERTPLWNKGPMWDAWQKQSLEWLSGLHP
jgi:hypothetical protein